MNDFQSYFADIIQSFEKINYLKFLLNLVVTAVLSMGISSFFIHFGNAATNRRRFAKNFLPLAMTTMLIIFIVGSSVALSLGLVGALSIVRFRSAIKEPEELTFLFLVIGVGLACGADEPMIAAVASVLILTIMFIQRLLLGKGFFTTGNQMHLNITANGVDLSGLSAQLSGIFSFVELKRMDREGERTDLSFVVAAKTVEELEKATQAIKTQYPDAIISFLEQRNVAQ